MTVEAGIELNLDIDLDKPLICEVVWATDTASYSCGRKAKWVGMAHDEVTDHTNTLTLLCGRCKKLALIKLPCPECDVPVITNLRRL